MPVGATASERFPNLYHAYSSQNRGLILQSTHVYRFQNFGDNKTRIPSLLRLSFSIFRCASNTNSESAKSTVLNGSNQTHLYSSLLLPSHNRSENQNLVHLFMIGLRDKISSPLPKLDIDAHDILLISLYK